MARVVYSKAGRDQGRMFVIVGLVNENFVLLSDGDLRKIENPKVKNVKHIHYTNMTADKVLEHLSRGELPGNHVIKKNLKVLLEARETKGKEVW
ncbi:MAG TPA: KOW domain-containing RNA-binding protein [Syntrophomonadaceae bacterium]|nr:KOW domain-containing RNA-binding protein [Syntrophomonadaceae bacterium]